MGLNVPEINLTKNIAISPRLNCLLCYYGSSKSGPQCGGWYAIVSKETKLYASIFDVGNVYIKVGTYSLWLGEKYSVSIRMDALKIN